MEEEQGNLEQRRNNDPPERPRARISTSGLCGLMVLAFVFTILAVVLISVTVGLSATTVWYLLAFLIGLISTFSVTIYCWVRNEGVNVCRNISRIIPSGLRRRAAEGGQPVQVQRRQEAGQRRDINAADAPRPLRASLLDAARRPPSLQNPVVVFHRDDSCRILPLDQLRTRAESTLSQEESSLLRPVSGESSAASELPDVASGVSDIPSIRTSGRERIRTRSMTRKQLEEASTSSAGQRIDPSEPGPSHLRSPERSLRNLRSKKTESESQKSDRQGALKSPLSGRRTTSSGGVRRREKFAARKGPLEKKVDYYYSESSDSERD